ncbi:MAG TPA: hypothetical protein PKA38_02190 [Candidatus Levybacteria bacterium]|nr:hypothetical protein [Candidatus Levybacteria bacterium]
MKGNKIQKLRVVNNNTPDAVYGLGLLGALVYYIINATSFWMGLLGVVKAIFWPAFLVFELLEFFRM